MYYVYKYINEKNEVLYVGQTIDLDRRFSEHKGRIWDLEKSKILFAKCQNEADMCIYEMYYINKLKSKYNTSLVYNVEPSFILPELEWQIYDKNHYEESKHQRDIKFKEELKNKFGINYWINKLSLLESKFDEETDFFKKKEYLIEIRKCKEKINNNEKEA